MNAHGFPYTSVFDGLRFILGGRTGEKVS